MDPSVAMAKLLAAALENRLNAPVPDGESGTQHTSCAKAPCFIAKDYCLQAARLHGGSRTASPHVVPPLCRFACNWQHGAAMRACRSTAGATAFGAGGCALADAPVKVRSGGGGGQGQDEHGERSVESCCKWCAERHFAVSFARFLNSLKTPLLPHCYKCMNSHQRQGQHVQQQQFGAKDEEMRSARRLQAVRLQVRAETRGHDA